MQTSLDSVACLHISVHVTEYVCSIVYLLGKLHLVLDNRLPFCACLACTCKQTTTIACEHCKCGNLHNTFDVKEREFKDIFRIFTNIPLVEGFLVRPPILIHFVLQDLLFTYTGISDHFSKFLFPNWGKPERALYQHDCFVQPCVGKCGPTI